MPPPSRPLVYAALVVMLVLSGLDQTVLSTALPTIARDLQATDELPWVFSAYLIASTTVIPLYGKLADRWGARSMLLCSTSLFALGSLACALAGSMPMLIGARAVQGLGGGGLLTLTMLAVATLYPPAERGKQMGMLGAAYGLSTMVGPLVGALFVEQLSWHWAFLVNVPVALAALAVFWSGRFGAPAAHKQPLDALGTGLLAAALICLLVAIDRPQAGLRGSLFTASAVLLSAWAWAQRSAADPVLPLSLFGQPGFAAAAAISTISGVALYALVVFVPLYLQTGLHFSAIDSAWHLLPLMVGITVGAQVAGRLLRARAPVRALVIASALLLAAAFAVLAWLLAHPGMPAGALSACVFPLGLGLGLLFPVVTMVSQRAVPLRQIGIATATPVMLRALGGALAVAAMGEVLHGRLGALGAASGGPMAGMGHPHFAETMASALSSIYFVTALICLAACVAARWLPLILVLAGPGVPATREVHAKTPGAEPG